MKTTYNYNPKFIQEDISDEISDIITYRPLWIVRRGNSFFAVILLLLISLTWWIQYPDVITGSVRLVAFNAPKLLTTKIGGKLEKLLVENEQLVEKGKPLALLQSSGSYEEIIILQDWVRRNISFAAANDYNHLTQDPLPLMANLGELQTSYQTFYITFQETSQLFSGGYFRKKKAALQKDLDYYASMQRQVQQQQTIARQDYNLQQKDYNAREVLEKEKVIAPLELNAEKSKLLAKQQQVELIASQMVNNNLAAHNKQKEIVELQRQIADQKQLYQSGLLNLKSKIEEWLLQFVLVAPEPGKVLFVSTLQENQFLKAGQELFYVEPLQTKYYAELMTAQKGLGKIKKDQLVIIKVESYPSHEFGYLRGKVAHIASIADRTDSFLVKVDLVKGLYTSANKQLYYRNHLHASGDIHTDNRRLFQRFWGQLQFASH